MVGSAIVRQLLAQGHPLEGIITRSYAELGRTNQATPNHLFESEKPDQVYLAAAGSVVSMSTTPAQLTSFIAT